jgi:cytochrome oxidase Cu insertion factor (SCO1/SenC/PrrC family)
MTIGIPLDHARVRSIPRVLEMTRMKSLRSVLVGVWLLAASRVLVTAQQPPPVDTSKIGPKVGEVAPEFTAVDQQGAVRSLKAAAGPNGTMLVFFRSADW